MSTEVLEFKSSPRARELQREFAAGALPESQPMHKWCPRCRTKQGRPKVQAGTLVFCVPGTYCGGRGIVTQTQFNKIMAEKFERIRGEHRVELTPAGARVLEAVPRYSLTPAGEAVCR